MHALSASAHGMNPMLLRFTKMHGCGNDFVVLDLITQKFLPKSHHMRKLADRHFGVGCDQILIVEAPTQPDVDFRYRIFNADGLSLIHISEPTRPY